MGELEGWHIAAALVPATIISVLFFFDHNVSSQLAQEGLNLKKPTVGHAPPCPVHPIPCTLYTIRCQTQGMGLRRQDTGDGVEKAGMDGGSTG